MLRRLEIGDTLDILKMLFSESRDASTPWVLLNMVASVDGATAVGGGASGLNDEDDKALFLALRAVADVVLVGASTLRSENLGPVTMTGDMTAFRQRAGLHREPRLAILSRSLRIDPEARVFSDPARRPIIITEHGADPESMNSLGRVADMQTAGRLDGGGIIEALGDVDVVLCEGGPTVNSQLIAADLVDEINLTVSPVFALGESKRVAMGSPLNPPLDLRLDRVATGDRSLFLRYVRDRPG